MIADVARTLAGEEAAILPLAPTGVGKTLYLIPGTTARKSKTLVAQYC